MDDSIRVSTDVLRNTAKKVRDINLVLDQKLAEINKNMNSLEQSYQSDASTEIRANMNALKPRFEEYKRVVESYADFLVKTAEQWETTEATITHNAEAFKPQ